MSIKLALLISGEEVIADISEFRQEETYSHRGLAQRSFSRQWSLSDDVEVKDVTFADGLLTITLGKIVPEHHAKKVYL